MSSDPDRDSPFAARLAVGGLLLYTGLMVLISQATSLEKTRYFFTDLAGPADQSHLIFYGLNTTLSVWLQWSCALLFAVRLWLLGDRREPLTFKLFLIGQMIFFLYLGTDDRFMLHERIEEIWGLQDYLLLSIFGLGEIVLLATWGRAEVLQRRSGAAVGVGRVLWDRPALVLLLSAGGAFALMLGLDTFGPEQAAWRLAAEDLAKTWSAFFLFGFAWLVCRRRVREWKK